MLSFDDVIGAQTLYARCSQLASAVIIFLSLASIARAETLVDTVRHWGLIGRWSLDCSLAPDEGSGAVLTYEILADDRVVHRRYFGNASEENDVVSAEVS
jgi:hypothetical protein